MSISVENLQYRYHSLNVLDKLTFSVEKHCVAVFLGPSGCGKTTLLKILAGILKPHKGTVRGISPEDVSFVFQEPRLLPWCSVAENIVFTLADKIKPERISPTINSILEQVDLQDYKQFFPIQLSGGMKQRVALARAFAFPSSVLLMDEPFQALDLALKLNIIRMFQRLWKNEKQSCIFVTHNVNEALLLGDKIFVLSKRPASIIGTFYNPKPAAHRSLSDEGLLHLERSIYRTLLESSGNTI